MRVGIDGYPLAQARTGVGHYTFELARALAQNFPSDYFELVSPVPFESAALAELEEARLSNLRTVILKSNSIRRRWWGVGLPLYARRAGFDLFHGTNFELPLWSSRRNVVTIHDLSVRLYPEMHRNRLVRRAQRRLPLNARLADRIITPTESVRIEVCERMRIDPEKVIAIHSAPRADFHPMIDSESAPVRRRLGVENEFLLFVGTLEPRKNLSTLIKACDEICCTTPLRPQLVIAGGEGWLMDEFRSLIPESVADRVRFTGYLPDKDLRALYSSCSLFIYPSIYEGFGFPPLEAMACGAPVLASRISALQEVLGDAAVLVEPSDAGGLASAIIALWNDSGRRKELSVRGRERASTFSWDRTARRTLDVYHQVMTLKK